MRSSSLLPLVSSVSFSSSSHAGVDAYASLSSSLSLQEKSAMVNKITWTNKPQRNMTQNQTWRDAREPKPEPEPEPAGTRARANRRESHQTRRCRRMWAGSRSRSTGRKQVSATYRPFGPYADARHSLRPPRLLVVPLSFEHHYTRDRVTTDGAAIE